MLDRPSDILDCAAELTQREIEAQLAAHRQRARGTQIKPKGFCYNCDEPLSPEQLFCDSDCRDDYQHIQERRKANGL